MVKFTFWGFKFQLSLANLANLPLAKFKFQWKLLPARYAYVYSPSEFDRIALALWYLLGMSNAHRNKSNDIVLYFIRQFEIASWLLKCLFHRWICFVWIPRCSRFTDSVKAILCLTSSRLFKDCMPQDYFWLSWLGLTKSKGLNYQFQHFLCRSKSKRWLDENASFLF